MLRPFHPRLAAIIEAFILGPLLLVLVGHLGGVAVEIVKGEVTVYDYGEPIIGTDRVACGRPARFAVSPESQSVISLPAEWVINGVEREWSTGRQSPEPLNHCVVFDRLNWACDGPKQTGGWVRMDAGQLGAFVEPPPSPPSGIQSPPVWWNRVGAYRQSMSWLHYRMTCGYSFEISYMRSRGLAYHFGWW